MVQHIQFQLQYTDQGLFYSLGILYWQPSPNSPHSDSVAPRNVCCILQRNPGFCRPSWDKGILLVSMRLVKCLQTVLFALRNICTTCFLWESSQRNEAGLLLNGKAPFWHAEGLGFKTRQSLHVWFLPLPLQGCSQSGKRYWAKRTNRKKLVL